LLHSGEQLRLSAPDGFTSGQHQLLIQQTLAQSRQKRGQRRMLEYTGTQRIGNMYLTVASSLQQTWHPKQGVMSQLQRVTPGIVDVTQDHINLIQTTQRTNKNLPFPDNKIITFDQREVHVIGQPGVLKITGAAGTRGKQHNIGLITSVTRQCSQTAMLGLQVTGKAL